METNNIYFNRMSHEDFWLRPNFLKKGYTFRNEGGCGDMVFTLLEDFNDDTKKLNVICHSLSRNYTHNEQWDDCQYLKGSFENGEYFPYWEDCNWLTKYYI